MKLGETTNNYEYITDFFSHFSEKEFLVLLRKNDKKTIQLREKLLIVLEQITNILKININLKVNVNDKEKFEEVYNNIYTKINNKLWNLKEEEEKKVINILDEKFEILKNEINEMEQKTFYEPTSESTKENIEDILKN